MDNFPKKIITVPIKIPPEDHIYVYKGGSLLATSLDHALKISRGEHPFITLKQVTGTWVTVNVGPSDRMPSEISAILAAMKEVGDGGEEEISAFRRMECRSVQGCIVYCI